MICKIAAVQMKISPSYLENLLNVEQSFEQARGCDFICFPELFITGPESLKTFNENVPLAAKRLFSRLARQYNMYAVMGSIHERKGKNLANVSYMFDRQGRIMGSYAKAHLVPRTEEEFDVIPGEESPVFDTEFGKVAIQICRDMFFPEVTAGFARQQAKIIFCPSFWPWKSTSFPPELWGKYRVNTEARIVDALVQARCFENNVVFVYANMVGEFSSKELGVEESLLGHTQIAVPFYGRVKALKNHKEGMVIHEVDLELLDDAEHAYNLRKEKIKN
jgi:predicted amidohydrolase